MLFEDPIEEILSNEWEQFSDKLDQTLLQDSFLWRTVTVSRQLSLALFTEEGTLDKARVNHAMKILSEKRFSLQKGRSEDADYLNHIYKILKSLESGLEKAIGRIYKPYINPLAERVIRATLHLSDKAAIGDREARCAVMAALLCRLRQNVGSCFATAPAIRIQQEYPQQLVDDLSSFFTIRSLRRMVAGIDYAVPFSSSFGLGELLKPIFLDQEKITLLASSPSLLFPLEEAAILDKQKSNQERVDALHNLLKKSDLLSKKREIYFFSTAEKILGSLIRAHFEVSKEEMEEAVFEGVTLMTQLSLAQGKKKKKREKYEKAFQKAKEVFISMTDNPLLKSWEFTLASLSESKADFAGWNMSVSLGLHPEEPHGIGQIIYTKIQEKVEQLQNEIEDLQFRYEQLYQHAKHIEGRLQQSRSENEINWLRAEYNVRKVEVDHALILRDEAFEKREKLTHLFSFILRYYQEKCKVYFQEVYDPEMQDVKVSLYDDSPAGFRLLYKHGRENPSLWSYIYSVEEYSEMLRAFFIATETELLHLEEVKGLAKELGEIVTSCVLGVKEKPFLEASFKRLAKAYGEVIGAAPLEHMAKIKRKPWAYISGGTMTTLLHCYYGITGSVVEKSRWIENETELFAFYLDSCRELPFKTQKKFLVDEEASLLAFSPTHAFLFKPGYSRFAEGWQSDRYSYTWIRDEIVNPAAKFIHSLELDREMIYFFTERLSEKIPKEMRSYVTNALLKIRFRSTPMEFRSEAIERLSYGSTGAMIREIADQMDALLYELLPFSLGDEIVDRITELSHLVDPTLIDKIDGFAKKEREQWGRYQLIGSQELLEITKGYFQKALGKNRIHFDLHEKLQHAMHQLGYALRRPVLFADTNWTKQRFGFCVNPGTLELELWRFDRTASHGRPMSIWKEYLNGQSKGSWGLLTHPEQYSEL